MTISEREPDDTALHQRMAEDAARLTLEYYLDGLVGERVEDPAEWGKEFFHAWDRRYTDLLLLRRMLPSAPSANIG